MAQPRRIYLDSLLRPAISGMPPRLSKRQQRELEELEALGGSSNVDDIDHSEEEETAKPAVAGFAAVRRYLPPFHS